MLCYVLIPDDLTDEQLYSPEACLRRLTIYETLLTRIVPSRERDSDPAKDSKEAKSKATSSKVTRTKAT